MNEEEIVPLTVNQLLLGRSTNTAREDYQRFKDAKRHKNLQKGDVCLLQYDGKFKHTYRLCIILNTFPSEGNIVRTVKVGFRPKRQCRTGPYKSVTLDELVVGVP